MNQSSCVLACRRFRGSYISSYQCDYGQFLPTLYEVITRLEMLKEKIVIIKHDYTKIEFYSKTIYRLF